MKALLQRVTRAEVLVEDQTVGAIGDGLVVLLGIGKMDAEEEARELAVKCAGLRLFSDADGKMNISSKARGAEALVISQFTLYGDTRKGTRPSYSNAAPGGIAEPLYEVFCEALEKELGADKVKRGVFGAMMDVRLTNNGPVTVLVESKGVGRKEG